MTDLRKAAEMALDALEADREHITYESAVYSAALALRQALAQPEEISDYHEGWEEGFKAGLAKAQPEQGPVALWNFNQGFSDCMIDKLNEAAKKNPAPLYTASQSKSWVSLTDEDFDNIYKRHDTYDSFAHAIEAKLKEKNGFL